MLQRQISVANMNLSVDIYIKDLDSENEVTFYSNDETLQLAQLSLEWIIEVISHQIIFST